MKNNIARAASGFLLFVVMALSGCGGGGGSSSSTSSSPGIAVSKTTLSTTEDGTEASFDVVLKQAPRDIVEVVFESQDTSEGLIDGSSYYSYPATYVYLTFTPADWNVPQTVTVHGQDDSLQDGNITYKVAVLDVTSSDPAYDGISGPSVSVTNADTDAAGITVSQTTLTTAENDSSYSYKSFSVTLNVAPTGTVTIPVTISDTTEGSFSSSSIVKTTTLTFDKNDWNSSWDHTVYVYAVDDQAADGNQTYDITVGPAEDTAGEYTGLTGSTVKVTNNDNDTANFTVSQTSLTTKEWGDNATFTVVLNTEPTEDVVIPVTSADDTEGTVSSDAAASAKSINLTFTPTNWQVAQTVTVNAVNDTLQDGDIGYKISVGAPTGASEYAALVAKYVDVVNVDDDTPKVVIVGGDLQTTETAGSGATFAVSLAKAPTADVVVSVTSKDTTEGYVKGGNSPTLAVSAINLTFTTANWKTAQTVTVVGQEDNDIDGNQAYKVAVAVDATLTLDAAYDALTSIQEVSATNADNDTAGMTLSTGSYYLSSLYPEEGGADDTFTVKLNTKPTANVTIPVTVSDLSQISVSSNGTTFTSTLDLTFTPDDWSVAQTVTVRAINDSVDEPYNQSFSVTIGAASSADLNYQGLAAKTVNVSPSDDDVAGFVVIPTTGLTTGEDGTTATFTVALATQPLTNISVTVTSGNTAEGLVKGGSSPTTPVSTVTLSFAPDNWSSAQTVTVVGQNDFVLDGPIAYDITVAPVPSSDSVYSSITPKKVAVTNSDNEVGTAESAVSLDAKLHLPYNGTVGNLTNISTYTLTGVAANWKYTLNAINVTDDITLKVNDGATNLCTSAKTGAKTSESCTFTTPSDGSVEIVVDGSATTNGAGFTLELGTVLLPSTFEVYLASTVDANVYLYDDTVLTSSYYYTIGSAYPTTGGKGVITKDLTPGKTYYLKVMHDYSASGGAYQVQVRDASGATLTTAGTLTESDGPNTAASTASPLALNTAVPSYLSVDDEDWYSFTVPPAP